MSYGFFRFVDAMPVLLAAIMFPSVVLVALTYFFRKGLDGSADASAISSPREAALFDPGVHHAQSL